MYRFLETIKIKDGNPQNLDCHQRRLNRTLKDNYSHYRSFILENLISVPNEFISGITKCRFLYNEKSFNIEYNKYDFKPVSSLKIVYSDNIRYNYKYVNRSAINVLLEQKGNCDDILIIKNDLVTDVSFANICFYDGKEWHTPSSPLLLGTCRDRLLQSCVLKEKDIKVSDLDKYLYFSIINSMRGEELTDIYPIRNIIS